MTSRLLGTLGSLRSLLSSRPSLVWFHRRWSWLKNDEEGLARFVAPICTRDVIDPVSLSDGRTVLEAVEAGDRATVAEALYENIRSLGIEYDRDSYTADGPLRQRVRAPSEMKQLRRGTCLDLALLFAGAALDARLQPIVFVFDDHAMAGFVNRGRPTVGPDTDPKQLATWIDDERIVAVECTGASRGAGLDYDFETARQMALEHRSTKTLRFAIDPRHLHELGFEPEPCDRIDARRVAVLIVGAVVALGACFASYRQLTRPEPAPPEFASRVDGVAFLPIDGDDDGEIGSWLADPLISEGVPNEDRLVELCPGIDDANPIEVWSGDITAMADLDDPTNPAGVDLVIRSSIVEPGDSPGSIDGTRLSLSLLPKSTSLRRAGDETTLAGLPRSPGTVDADRTSINRFFELRVLPAILAGLREIDDGTPASFERASCAFGAVETMLAGEDDSTRKQQFLASIDVFEANAWILHAGNADEESEQRSLEKAEAALMLARSRVDDPDALAVIDANAAGLTTIRMIADDGSLVDDVTLDELESTMDRFVTMSDDDISPVATVLLRSLAARLALAGWNEVGPLDPEPDLAFASLDQADGLNRQAEALATSAIEAALADPENDDLLRYRADAHSMLARAHYRSFDAESSAEQFGFAASLVGGSSRQSHLLNQAVALMTLCRDELDFGGSAGQPRAEAARAEAEAIIEDAQNYVDEYGDPAVTDLLAGARSQTCP